MDITKKLGRSWYHPRLTVAGAEKLLMTYGKVGSFLVRPSTEKEDQCALSVRDHDRTLHFHIFQLEESISLGKSSTAIEQFGSIPDLLSYYMCHPLIMDQTRKTLQLSQVVNNPDPTNERWFHGYITGLEARELLSKFGKRRSFLMRESRTQPGSYALCVRVNKEREPEAEVTQLLIKKSDTDHFEIEGSAGNLPKFDDLVSVVDYFIEKPCTSLSGLAVRLKHPLNSSLLTASNIKQRIDKLTETKGFSEEFISLQNEAPPSHLTKIQAQNPANKPKNRYKNILPYDHTLVTLEGEGGYINANRLNSETIDSELEPVIYIATQGPLAHTIADFWRLVLQENIRIIIMTTKLVERGKNKCARYWPHVVTESQEFNTESGTITVTNLSEKPTTEHILRKFRIKRDGAEPVAPREIYQYHYMAWPDFGVPKDPGSVLNFMHEIKVLQKQLRSSQPNIGPPLIHCSAGIGRTGTVVVIDIILKQLMKRGVSTTIDIMDTIRKLRMQREGMIQTEPQYNFIYVAIEHYVGTMIQRMQRDPTGTNESIYENIYG